MNTPTKCFAAIVMSVLVAGCSTPSGADGGGGGAGGGSGGGAGGGSGGSGGGGGRIDDVCGTMCAKLVQCALASDAGCLSECQPQIQPFRDEFTQAWARCTQDTACGALITTTSSCDDAGTSCGTSTVNNCMVSAQAAMPDSVLDGFLTTACARLVGCGTWASDGQCRSGLLDGGVPAVPELKPFPSAGVDCTAQCLGTRACPAQPADVEALVVDCANRTCGLKVGK